MICINLTAQPGAGKSTLAAATFAKLKMLGINCELVTEFAKDKVWENNKMALSNQIYIFAKQYYRMDRCAGKVDVIITDSPLTLTPLYCKDKEILEPLTKLSTIVFNRYDNLNYFIRRVKKYNPVGREQTEAESDALIPVLKKCLADQNIAYKEIDGDLTSVDIIVHDVLKLLGIEAGNH